MVKMSLIDQLNNKLDYNKEVYILSGVLTIVFLIGNRYSSGGLQLLNLFIALLFFGIMISYSIYDLNPVSTYGYRLRNKIRRLIK